MTRQIRRKFAPQEPNKVTILRQHLLEAKPVSDDCDSHGLKPSLFYRWQKEFVLPRVVAQTRYFGLRAFYRPFWMLRLRAA